MPEGPIHTHQEIEKMEEDILSHKEAPKTILELQFILADELYEKDHKGEELNFNDRDTRNMVLSYWIDSGYSRVFRRLVDEKVKKEENPMEITLEELVRMNG